MVSNSLGPILINMLYLGPFRNSVNIGGENQYYDMLIGEPFIIECGFCFCCRCEGGTRKGSNLPPPHSWNR